VDGGDVDALEIPNNFCKWTICIIVVVLAEVFFCFYVW
jgi:hypothetical protein